MSDIDDMTYGPSLPPGYTVQHNDNTVNTSRCDGRKSCQMQGPSLPEGYKPQKQPSSSSELESDKSNSPELRKSESKKRKSRKEHLPYKKSKPASGNSEDSDSDSSCKSDKSSGDEYGPCLPPGYVKRGSEKDSRQSTPKISSFIGPVIPTMGMNVIESHLSEDEGIGPMPSEMATGNSLQSTTLAIEKRSERMKETLKHGGNSSNIPEPTVRDEWMTELPSSQECSYDLVNRTFQKNPQKEVGDQSVWTDTPADRERKEREKDREEECSGKKAKEIVNHAESARDKYLSQKIEEYNKNKRPESLLEIHRKKKKKKEKKEKKDKKKKKKHKEKHKADESRERRAFDRDLDLQIDKRLTHAQKKSIIGNAQQLNLKFSHGHSKFL